MEKFSYEANGYNRSEVNQFVSDVISETEDIVVRVQKQRDEIENLKKELEHYKELENTLKNAIIKAEETGDSIRQNARQESEMIIDNAKHNASRIINEALIKSEKIENTSDLLQRNMNIFKRKLKILMDQQQAIVDEIEVLELDDDKEE